MRTTEARQLLPDAWGFICPVHTPDGTPCGLLNHLTVDCVVSDSPNVDLVATIPSVLTELGMIPLNTAIATSYREYYVVMLEGRIIGHIRHDETALVEKKLRLLKIEGVKLPNKMEIVVVPNKNVSKSNLSEPIFIIMNVFSIGRSIPRHVPVCWIRSNDASCYELGSKQNRVYRNI